jgi:hypothetical protein
MVAEHQDSHLPPPDIVLLRHIYDFDITALVYWYNFGHGGVFRHAPCE